MWIRNGPVSHWIETVGKERRLRTIEISCVLFHPNLPLGPPSWLQLLIRRCHSTSIWSWLQVWHFVHKFVWIECKNVSKINEMSYLWPTSCCIEWHLLTKNCQQHPIELNRMDFSTPKHRKYFPTRVILHIYSQYLLEPIKVIHSEIIFLFLPTSEFEFVLYWVWYLREEDSFSYG